MNIGFTGTQRGMTREQQERVRQILIVYHLYKSEFHYGGCIGADEEAAAIAKGLKYQLHCHQPDDKKKFARTDWDVIYEPLPYLVRNKDIVDMSELLIVAPKEKYEILRSGTWSTFRYALKIGRKIELVLP